MQQLWDWIDANYHEDSFNINDARDMSIKLEKEQIMDDFNAGQWAWAEHLIGKEKKDPAEYYNETYKK